MRHPARRHRAALCAVACGLVAAVGTPAALAGPADIAGNDRAHFVQVKKAKKKAQVRARAHGDGTCPFAAGGAQASV